MRSPEVDSSYPDPVSQDEEAGFEQEEPSPAEAYAPRAARRQQGPAWQSPVAQHAQAWAQPGAAMQPKKSLAWLWAVLGAAGAVVLAAVIFFSLKVGTDPFRSLEEFPVETYLRNPESLLGSRFKAELTLEAELGGEMGRGRLFSFRSPPTGRILPVLIPEHIQQGTFDRGQRYLLEMEVRQGGVIQANGCKKS